MTAFDVLQQFGGSRQKGSSDHCPLWCRIERGEKAKHVAVIEEMRVNEEFLERDILREIDKLAKRPEPPEFEEMEMSEAFMDEDSDDEEIDNEDVYGVEEDDERQRPFEDCPMPILKCAVRTVSEQVEMKMLIDSGSSLDLIGADGS